VRLHQRLGGAALRRRVVDALARLKIPAAQSRLADYPHQMSGGMRQRVCGAVALSCQPRLVIADEPTTSLDVTIQAQYLELLREIQEQSHISVIFITHDFGIVAATAHRVAVMYAGKIVEIGTTEEIFDKPVHPYTEALLRCVPRSDRLEGRLLDIPGQPPDLASLPPGCSFAPRCPRVMDRCRESYPPEVEVSPGHTTKCWLAEKDR
jgi:oligopeptide/dipeptide ABC transporter ATP-binding protein